ncbi:PREDICTED: uncharacterized protein LOC108569994 [Nicrophorus vespilloides]|uniref:Uncharacterized protein LOC108569994 n=1 Tax=Nicrophorus vespilloides TaxID=110193 RepID=A0ABM1NKD6_NICVS|nr:PREDICTED: uncharacterized protein LOC108569994 [Nicrophorus vespilloides]
MEFRKNHPSNGKRRTAVPVLPPRIPTPMPSANNNNSKSSIKDAQKTVHVISKDNPQTVSKMVYKTLDNEVKTAWINPRLISKIDLEMIKSNDYKPPAERNMNGHYNHNLSHQKMHHQQNLQHLHQQQQQQQQQQQGKGPGEWEQSGSVNGRASKSRSSVLGTVPTLTHTAIDARRSASERRNATRQPQQAVNEVNKHKPSAAASATTASSSAAASTSIGMEAKSKVACYSGRSAYDEKSYIPRSLNRNRHAPANNKLLVNDKVAYQSAASCFIGHDSGVFGVYSETKYTFSVNGLPGNQAQASAAAAFFAR